MFEFYGLDATIQEVLYIMDGPRSAHVMAVTEFESSWLPNRYAIQA